MVDLAVSSSQTFASLAISGSQFDRKRLYRNWKTTLGFTLDNAFNSSLCSNTNVVTCVSGKKQNASSRLHHLFNFRMLSFRPVQCRRRRQASLNNGVDATQSGDGKTVRGFDQTAKVDPMQSLRNLVRNEDGATAIEYALIASMIAMAIVAGVHLMGTQLSTVYVNIGNALN